MADLKAVIESTSNALEGVHARLATTMGTNTTVPLDCYRVWMQRAALHSQLKATIGLLPMRTNSWTIINTILTDRNIRDRGSSLVLFCDQEMQFAVARHLALSSYITLNWTIYDRLSNVCGRLIGHENIGSNPLPTSNPKLVEHFLRESKDRLKQHGFSLARILSPAYGWPAALSYEIRNWIVHEGLDAEGVALFSGDNISDSFELSSQAMTRIEEKCKADGITHAQSCLSQESNHPWYDKSILTVLSKCHLEVDAMFVNFVRWSVDSLICQYTTFAGRDNRQLSATATVAGVVNV